MGELTPVILHGLDIRVSEGLLEQYRFPRTKKRRIRNKWAKRPGNLRPARKAMFLNNLVIMHPDFYQSFIKSL